MPLSPSPVTTGEHDGLGTNPWVESSNALHASVDRKTSEQSASDIRKDSVRPCHVRSHTTAGHPLRVASPLDADERHDSFAFTRGASLDLHETRPSLKRIIDTSISAESGDVQGGGATSKDSPAREEAGAEVIVHRIQSTDSLAGVALKYNISVAALRSANKLWASDSIHLRQILYIPIQTIATQRGKPSGTNSGADSDIRPSLLQSTPTTQTALSSHRRKSVSDWYAAEEDSETTITHASAAHTIAASTDSTIRRVPLSELSFFPPPSASATPPSGLSVSRTLRPQALPSFRPDSSHATRTSTLPRGSLTPPFFSGTPAGHSNGNPALRLTGFFNGAKEEIISRLSLDSVRGSSDTTEDPEVEMDIVRPKTTLNRQNRDITTWQDTAGSLSDSALECDSTSPKLTAKPVRTLQLQPSPKMQIPTVSRVDKASIGTRKKERIV